MTKKKVSKEREVIEVMTKNIRRKKERKEKVI